MFVVIVAGQPLQNRSCRKNAHTIGPSRPIGLESNAHHPDCRLVLSRDELSSIHYSCWYQALCVPSSQGRVGISPCISGQHKPSATMDFDTDCLHRFSALLSPLPHCCSVVLGLASQLRT